METAKSGLIADVTNGVLNYKASAETSSATKRGTSELGKDAFLQLLVCQMQNQDPLEPSEDTEFVSQLAQFSQLEQLQNLSGESEKSQAFSLVGKYVIFQLEDSNGKTTYPEGVVDFVNMSGTTVQLSVNGTIYDYEDLYTVVDDAYYITQNIPKIENAYTFNYNAKSPEDFSFTVDFGKNDYKASEVAVIIGGKQIDGSYLRYRDNTVTIDKEAFTGFDNGEYPVSVVFNNSLYTTITDKISVRVYNQDFAPSEEAAPEEITADA